jgi:DNA-binding transcriptional regulator LsrR (DeoR family)
MKAREDLAARLDEAARAGWLYYVAGNTQEEIATKLGISRQAAQRLVSLSVSAGLVRVRIDHPIAACLDLSQQLQERFSLRSVEVVPSDPAYDSTILGIAEACAERIERELRRAEPLILGIGTGRTLRAAVERLPPIVCPQHRVVSLTGNIGADGSAAIYNVIFSMADKIQAPHHAMPVPVIASSPAERDLLHRQKAIQNSLDLASRVDVAFVGIGEIGPRAPLMVDGYISEEERQALVRVGGVGEILGWVFDEGGRMIDDAFNERVVSPPIPRGGRAQVIAVAMGREKVRGIHGAMRGGIIDGLITDETTAKSLLSLR